MADAFTSDTYNALCREAEDYLGRGLTEQARELLLKAVSLIGTRSRARSLLADTCMALGLWSEAREQLEQLITLELGSVQHHYRLGQVLEELKENENALDNYRVVLDLERDHRGASVAVSRITGHAEPSAQAQPGVSQTPSAAPSAPPRPAPTGSFQVFPDQTGAEDEFATSGDVENLLRDIGVVQSSDPLSGVSELLSSVGISLDPPAPEEKPKVEVKDAGSIIGSSAPEGAGGQAGFSLESVFGPAPEPAAVTGAPAPEAAPETSTAPEPFDFTSIFRAAEAPAPAGPAPAVEATPADSVLQSIFGTGPFAAPEPAEGSGAAAVAGPAASVEPEAAPGPLTDAGTPPAAEPAAAPEPGAPAVLPETPSVPAAAAEPPAEDNLPVLESIFSFSTGEAEPAAAAAAPEAPAEAGLPSAPMEPAAVESPEPATPPAEAAPEEPAVPAESSGPAAPVEPPAPEPSPAPSPEPVRTGDVSLEVIFGEAPEAAAEPAPGPAPEPAPETAPAPSDEPAVEAMAEDRVEAPSGVPVDTPAEASLEALMEAPVEPQVEAPVDTPAEASLEALMEAPVELPVEAPVETPAEAPAGTAPGPALFEIHDAGPDELTRVDLLEGRLEVKLAFITSMDASISVTAEDRKRILSGTGSVVLGQASRTPVILDIASGDLVRSDRLVLHDAGMIFSDAPSAILPSMVRVGGEGGWALAFTGGRSAVLQPGAAGITIRAACIVQMQQGISAEADPDNQGFVRLTGDGTVVVST